MVITSVNFYSNNGIKFPFIKNETFRAYWLSLLKVDSATKVQILSKAVSISHGSLALIWQPVYDKETEFKPVTDLERDGLIVPKKHYMSSVTTGKQGYGILIP